MKRPKKIRKGNQPWPWFNAWMASRPKPVGIFGVARDFPITTKELATTGKTQRELFDSEPQLISADSRDSRASI